MKSITRVVFSLMLVFILCGFNRFDPAESQAPTEEQLVAYVQEAAAFAAIYGKEAAVHEFMKKNGIFNRGELYIFAYDYDCKVVAHGANPEWVGNDYSKLKDPVSGERTIQKMADIARKQTKGKITYRWFHPRTRKIMTKVGYVMKVDDTWWLGSGFYVPE